MFLIALCAICMGNVAAGGDDEESPSTGSDDAAATAEPAEKIKVGMVTNIGGLNDRSFNQSAYEGLKRAESELGIEIRAVTSKSNADYVPNLTSLARQKYDLVIAVGFLMAEATEKVAGAFPDTNFAIIDSSQAAMQFEAQEHRGHPLQGELGGLPRRLHVRPVREGRGRRPGRVLGRRPEDPPVDAYIAGFQQGAKDANPDIKTLNGLEDFVDQAKCKELALDQIAEGSQVVFQVAGQCGLGALDAAKEKGKQGIGVDADQGYLGDHVMTSALKTWTRPSSPPSRRSRTARSRRAPTTCSTSSPAASGYGKTTRVEVRRAGRRSRRRSSPASSRTSRPRCIA